MTAASSTESGRMNVIRYALRHGLCFLALTLLCCSNDDMTCRRLMPAPDHDLCDQSEAP